MKTPSKNAAINKIDHPYSENNCSIIRDNSKGEGKLKNLYNKINIKKTPQIVN